ncbi:hypothetical protein ACIRG5_01275 [Lentzea sp. NPDC102401]|uniref:hypothetical protein n=1 Tax=Lentzea sp. NPDC102401 TaxID=3364128 RepID=UPI003821769F
MRILTRLGVALAAVTALVATTGGVASAATAGYYVAAKHSSGRVAASSGGDLTWSSSLRTVTISNAYFSVIAGEWGDVSWQGYQGNTEVDSGTWKELDQRGLGGRTVNYKPFTLTADVPGGITNVRITVRDIDHQVVAKVHCYYYMTSC